MDKSYVTLEQHVCMICGKAFDTNNLLLDTRLRERFDHHTVTGFGICQDCTDSLKEGEYIALVGCDDSKSKKEPNGTIKPENAHRTGDVVWMRRTVFGRMFNVQPGIDGKMVFIEPEVIEKLKVLAEESNKGENHE